MAAAESSSRSERWTPGTESRLPLPILSRFRHGDERLAGPHDERLREVHPAALAHGRRRQQTQALAGSGFDLEDFHPPPRLDALQVEAG